ncbi:MAG: beta-ketoacyl synthase N-terminal-like domain-containing protein [Paracoccaceae bacterium]
MTTLYIKDAAALSPLGENLDVLWQNVLQGKTAYGAANLPGDRSFFAAESRPGSASDVSAYAPLFYQGIHDLIDDLDVEAPVDAIFFATAVGNLADVENEIYSERDVSAELLDFAGVETVFKDAGVSAAKTKFICVPTGCCAGLQAIGLAKSVLESLGLKTAIIMSLDFGLTPLAFEAFNKINATRAFDRSLNASPSRPFCTGRSGFLFADGGGAILVTTEQPDTQTPRISGYGCVSSAFHMTDIATDGHSIRDSALIAMSDANVSGSQIDHVNLHASGTQQNDEAEFNALVDIIGDVLPPITAFKSNHGHALGGANLIEIALSWKMMLENIVPPTAQALPIDAYEAVTARAVPTPFDGSVILKTASGFSGIHASLIMEN